MAKIAKLTPDQERALRAWHAAALAVGTSCEPADRPRAEAAICRMYALVGKRRPMFAWCDSPATAALASAFLRDWTHRRSSLKRSLVATLVSSLQASLRRSLESSLEPSLWSSLGSSLEYSLSASLSSSLRSALDWSLEPPLAQSFWGQLEYAWIAFFSFCETMGVAYEPARAEQLRLWDEVARSCGWWCPFRDLVIVMERPAAVRMERSGGTDDFPTYRLHCETGPALLMRDGWAAYAIHGTRVPAALVEAPETLTIEQITSERNAEVRRIMIDRFGAARFLRGIDAELVHVEHGEGAGREVRPAGVGYRALWRASLPGDVEPLMMVDVVNSAPEPIGYVPDPGQHGVWNGNRFHRMYMLRVDPRLRPMYAEGDPRGRFGKPQKLTAHNAIASTMGLRGEEYAPLLES